MAFALAVEGTDYPTRLEYERLMEKHGHNMRAEADPAYKRATWGLRPEDIEDTLALMGDINGER